MRRKRIRMWTAGLLGMAVQLLPVTAHAQACAVAEVGPFSLTAKQEVRVCGNNLYGNGDIKVGIATFDALDAREPLDLRFVTLKPREGFCLSPRLGTQRQASGKSVREVIVQAGAAIDVGQVSPFPIVLSVQRDTDAADYVLWRDNVTDINV